MFLRIDKLQIELPRPTESDPESAGIVQELMGGKFGEMSTLMNYTYQSFNMRGKSKIRPYYDLVANIAAEEMGHIELVANTINLLLDQTEASTDEAVPPLNFTGMTGNPDHFVKLWPRYHTRAARAARRGRATTSSTPETSSSTCFTISSSSRARGWARSGSTRATQNPVAREMVGYLIVRGGVHQEAYAKALWISRALT